MRTGAALAAMGCLLAVCAPGCASSTDDGGRENVDELLDRLPGDTDQLTVVDLALAKRQLGVAADLDRTKYVERQGTNSPEERFDTLAGPLFTFSALPDDAPRYLRAIDLGQVAAGVSSRGRSSGATIMLATPQPIEGLRRAIRAAGLGSLGDDIYFVKNPDAIPRNAVVGLRDGLIVIGESSDVVSGALRRKRPDPRLARIRRLLELTRGASRAIRTFKSDEREDEAPCISAIAGGDRLAASEDTDDLVVAIDGEPRPENVMLGSRSVFGTTRTFRARDASRSGTTLRVSVRAVPNDFSAQGASDLARYAILHGVYRCSPEVFAQAVRTFPNFKHPAPDRSGSPLETEISDFMSTGTKSPTALRVRCDSKTLVPGATSLRCRATRRFRGRVLDYVLQVGFTPARKVRVISVYSAEDKTGHIPIAGAREPRRR